MARHAELSTLRRKSAHTAMSPTLRSGVCLLGASGIAMASLLMSTASPANVSWQSTAAFSTDMQTQGNGYMEMICKERTPFLVAAVTFGVQTVTTLGCTWVVWHMAKSAWFTLEFEKVPELIGVLDALKLYVVISSACFLGYSYFAFGCGRMLFIIVPGTHGIPHLGLRNVLWLITTPLQWLCFCRACTQASTTDVAILMGSTVIMQVLGILMLVVSTPCIWHFLFVTCTLSLVVVFWKALHLSLLPDFESVARPVLYTELILWFAYPVVVVLRASNMMGVWAEQVIVYTILDMTAKTVSLSAILMAHVHIIILRVNVAIAHANSINSAGPQFAA